MKNNSLSLKAKNALKRFPFFYDFCRFILAPGFRFYPAKRNKALKKLLRTDKDRILNIGSGCTNFSRVVVNTDICVFKGVDVVSDAHVLAFKDEKFEGVILESLLEHVLDPELVVAEAFRVLKKGGIMFVELPFMYEFHQAPADYYRFTLPGIERLFRDFKKIDAGIDIGPTGTLNAVLRNYFALVFSFGIPAVYDFLNMLFGLFLFPLKVLDYFLNRFNCAGNIASAFYFIGKK